MKNSIYAQFESTDAAELAALRLRESLQTLQKTNVTTYHAESLQEDVVHLTKTTLLPTAVTAYNYITLLVESELDRQAVLEPLRRQDALLHAVCEETEISHAKQMLTALGGSQQQVYSLHRKSRTRPS